MARNGDCNSKCSNSKKWQCGDPYQFPIPSEGDHWERLLEPLLEKDRIQCESWKDEVQNLLIFAGLFSAVLSAFVVVSYSSLQPDQNEIMIALLAHIATRLDNTTSFLESIDLAGSPPTPSSIRVNVFWFIGLVLSLTTALIGIVSLQWLREHQQYPNSLPARQKFALLNMRMEGLAAWYVPQVFSSLPLLLQLALLLFFVGLIDFLLAISLTVAIPVIIFICIPFAFLVLTTIIPAFQIFFLLCSLLLQRHKQPRQENVESIALELKYITEDVYYALQSSSWLSLDKEWIVMRDAYAKTIFDKARRMTMASKFLSTESAPFYDLTRGIVTAVFEYAKSDPIILRSGYHSVEELTSSIIGDNASTCFRSIGASYNRYLQSLLTTGDIEKPDSTFSSLLERPHVEFMQDENKFIFLSLHVHPPPLIAQHYAELHIRIVNYLYSRVVQGPLRDPSLKDFVAYPDRQLFWCYSKFSPQEKIYGRCFESAISEQLSYFINAYLEVIVDPSVGEDILLTSLHSYKSGRIFEYAVVRQSPDSVPYTVDLLSRAIRNSMAEPLTKRSDLLFYMASVYTRCLILKDPMDTGLKTWEEVGIVTTFQPVLRSYLATRTPDIDIRKRLGIPHTSEVWWEFLHRQEDKSDAHQDRKSSSSKSFNIDSPQNDTGPLSSAVEPMTPNEQLGNNDSSKLTLHAENLV